MAKIDIARMKVGVDIEVNRGTLNDLKRALSETRADLNSKIEKNGMTKSLEDTLRAANELESVLNKSWNSQLGQLDLTKLNNGMKNTLGSAENIRQVFADYPNVYSMFERKIIESNVQLKKSNQLLDKMAITMSNTIRFGISSAIFNKVTGSISEAYNYAKKLDKSLNDIRIVSGASADEMDRFAVKANKAAKELSSTTLNYSKAALIYYQQGDSEEDVIAKTNATIKMSNVLGESADQVSDYMTAIWNNFGDGTHSLEYYGDVITALGAKTASSAEEIAGGLEKFAAIGKTIGLSYEYATAALTTITAKTRQSEDVVGTALKTIFSRIQGLNLGETLEDGTTLNKYSESLAKVGINIKDANGELKDMDILLNEMGAKWGTLSKDQQVALAQSVAGVRQYNQLIALMDNWDFMKVNLDTAADAYGTLNKQQEIYAESTEAHLNKLQSEAEKTYATLFDTDMINGFADAATGALSVLNSYLTGLGGGLNSLVTLGLQATNLFSKQLAAGIENNLQNSSIANNSEVSAKMKESIIASHAEKGESVKDPGLEAELEVSKKILSVRNNLTDEEAKSLISQQNKIGLLADQIDAYKKIDKKVKEILGSENEFRIEDINADLETAQEQLNDYSKALNNLKKQQVKNPEDTMISEDIQTYTGYVEEAKAEVQRLAEAKKLAAQVDFPIDDLIDQKNAIEDTIDATVRQKEEEKAIQDSIRGLTTWASAATSLMGIFKTFQNPDMSAWEKTESILLVVGTQTVNIIKNWDAATKLGSNLKTVLPAIAAKFGLVTTAEGATAAGATAMWTAMLWPIAIIIAALAALGVAIYAVLKWWNKDADAAKEAAKAAEEAREAADNAKEAYTQLAETFDKYDAGIKKLEELTVGTDEYTAALKEANNAAMDLIKADNSLAKYAVRNEKGLIEFQKNGKVMSQEEILAESRNRMNATEAAANVAQVNANNKSLKSQRTNLIRSADLEYTQMAYDGTMYKQSIDDSQLQSIINAINNGDGGLIRSDIEEVVGGFGDLTDAQRQEVIDSVMKADTGILNLAKSTEDLNATNKLLLQQTLESSLENNKEYAKMNDAQKLAVSSLYGKGLTDEKESELRKKAEETWNHDKAFGYGNEDEVHDKYAEIMGYTLASDKIGDKAVYVDKEGKQVTVEDDTARAALINHDVQEGLKDYDTDSLNKIMAAVQNVDGKALGEKYGADFQSAVLQSVSAGTGKIDFSSIFADISPSELVQIMDMTPDKIISEMGLSEEDLAVLGFDSAQDFAKAFQEGFDGYEWNLEDSIKNAINKDEDDLKKKNLDTEEVEDYTRQLMVMAEANEDLADTLSEDSDAALDVAKTIMVMNDGIEDLAKNWEDWDDILKNSSKTSEEYAEALGGVRSAMSKILGVEEDSLSNEFLEAHLDDIAKAAEGDETAIENLRTALQDDLVANIVLNNDDFSEEKKNELIARFNELENKFSKEMILGMTLTGDDELVEDLQKVLDDAQMTEEEANKYLQSIGMEPIYEQQEQEEVKEVPQYTVTPSFAKKTVDFGPLGKHEIPSGLNFKVTQSSVKELTGKTTLGAITTNGTTPKIKTLKKVGGTGTAKFNNYSSGNPGGGSASGGGSSSKPDKMEAFDKEQNRYHKVDTQLTKIGKQISKLEKEEEKFFGAKLLDNLNKQLALYNKQIETTTEKIKIANGEADELRDKLTGKGVSFNADGTVSNYMEILAAQEKYVNGLINNYNSMSKDAQESYKDVVEQAKKDYEELQTNLDRYDELISSTLPDLEASIQEAIDKQIEIQIKEFDMAIDLHLDLAEAEKEWINFRRRIIDGIKDDDILGLAQANFDQLDKYFDGGLLADETSHLLEIIDEINIIKNGGKSNIYGDNMQTALEELEKYYKQSMSDLEELQDTIEEIEESFIDMMDKVADEMSKQNDLYSMLSDTLDHDMEVIKLAYGDTSYQELESYFAQKEENLRNQLDFQRQQVELWQQQMDTLEKGSEAWEVAKENWMDAVSEWQSNVEAAIENIQEKYANAIQAIFKELNNTLTKGAGLDYINQEWELISRNSEEYLDTINREYQLQKLQARYLEGIDDTDNIAAKRKLNDLMTKELEMLREQDKLSQYDLDRANLKYEIALKRIALEEAQQNKSTMRLRRDSQGNYSYQYTANNDEISSIQQELSDLLNQLYNMDTSQYSDNLSKIYDIWAEYQDKMAEAAAINDPEAREQRELLLNEYYGGLINDLVGSNLVIRNNLYDSAFLELEDLYDEDYAKFATLADAEKEILMTDMIPQWESGIQSMVDVFAGEGGFEQVCEEALQQIAQVTQQYEQDLVNLQNTAGVSFGELSEGLDPIVDKTRTLVNDNNALITAFNNELAAISDLLGGLDLLAQKYDSVRDATEKATKAAYDLWAEQKRQAEEEAKKNEAKNNQTNIVNSTSGDGSSGGSGGGSSSPYGYASNGAPFIGTYTVVKGDTLWGIGRKYGIDWNRIYAENRSVIGSNPNLIYPGQKYKIPQYETGGYTGDWSGKDGQLAVLHPRELVLNANDTENMLKAIEMLRDMTSGFMYQQLASISAPGLSGINGGQLLEQDVHIEANFPNVSSANEIETALNNLVNAATQHIHTNR